MDPLQLIKQYSRKGHGKAMALAGFKHAPRQLTKKEPSPPAYFQPATPMREPEYVMPMDRKLSATRETTKRKLELEAGPIQLPQFKRKHQLQSPSLLGIHGLANLGNTCYMNAVLQVLTSIPCFVSDLQQPKLMDAAPQPQNSIYKALLQVVQQLKYGGESRVIDPSPLKASIARHSSRFRGALQQDAHEFFCNLLDQLQQEVVGILEARLQEAGSLRHVIELSKTACPTARNFSCILEHELKCEYCGDQSSVKELFQHFSLDIPEHPVRKAEEPLAEPSPVYNLQALLQMYFQEEAFEKTCEKCTFSGCIVRRTILRLPRVLVLHMKRFSVKTDATGEQKYVKRQDQVKVPKIIDLEFCCSTRTRGILQQSADAACEASTSSKPGPPGQHRSPATPVAVVGEKPLADISNIWHEAVRGDPPDRMQATRWDDAQNTCKAFEDDLVAIRSRGRAASREESVATVSRGHLESKEAAVVGTRLAGFSSGVVHMEVQSKAPDSERDAAKAHLHECSAVEDEDLKRALEKSAHEFLQSSALIEDTLLQPAVITAPNVEPVTISQEERDLEAAIAASLADAAASPSSQSAEDRSQAVGACEVDPKVAKCSPPLIVEIEDTCEEGTNLEAVGTEYVLHGILSHLGSTASSGHFVADVFDVSRQQWVRHDDSVVRAMDESSIFSAQNELEGYLFFYVHRDLVQHPKPNTTRTEHLKTPNPKLRAPNPFAKLIVR